jgi:hypothetical protein
VPRLPLLVPTVNPGLLDAGGLGWADCDVLAEADGVELFEQATASRPVATTITVAFPMLELTISFLHMFASDIAILPAISLPGGYYGRAWPRDCREWPRSRC